MSYARLIVGNKSGTLLDELTADIEFVNWRLNNIGKLRFNIARTDSKATANNLAFGNRVMVQFDNGLPDWGGVIDPPRKWRDDILTVDAYTAGHIFAYRTTDKARYFSGDPVGTIFQALINDANGIEDTGVDVGAVYTGGDGHSPDYHFKNLLAIFQESLTGRLSNYDFDFVPFISGGKIQFLANLYESKGSSKTGLVLAEGSNIANIELLEQGPIVNAWHAAGEGTEWGDARLTSYAYDQNNINLYGLREGSNVYSDVKEQATLDAHAATSLANSKDPTNIWSFDALDVEPAGFEDYDVGDVINLLAPSFGFGGTETMVRILAREFVPDDGTCSLVVEESF